MNPRKMEGISEPQDVFTNLLWCEGQRGSGQPVRFGKARTGAHSHMPAIQAPSKDTNPGAEWTNVTVLCSRAKESHCV